MKKRRKATQPAPRPPAPWILAGLALLLCAGLLYQIAAMTLVKAGHNLKPAQLGFKLEKGDKDGQVLSSLGMLGDAQGNFYHLDRGQGFWRLQKFSPEMAFLKAWRMDLARHPGTAWARCLAIAPDGRLAVGLEDGKLIPVDAELKPGKPVETGVAGMSAMDFDAQGNLHLLGPAADRLRAVNGEGQAVETPFTKLKLSRAYHIAFARDGGLLVLEARGEEQRLRVFSPEGKPAASFMNGYQPGGIHMAAVDGLGRIYLNENSIGLGVTVRGMDGAYIGKVTHVTRDYLLDKQGFVGANRFGDEFYLNYPAHVAKFRLVQ